MKKYILILFILIFIYHISEFVFLTGESNFIFDFLFRISLLVYAFSILKKEGLKFKIEFNLINLILLFSTLYLAIYSVKFVRDEFLINQVSSEILYSIIAKNILVGISEEVICRYLFFVLFLRWFFKREKRNFVFLSIVWTTILFSLMHLGNLFQMSIASTMTQLFSAIAVGLLFSIIFVATKWLVFPILLHFVFNILGTYSTYLNSHVENVEFDQLELSVTFIFFSLITFVLGLISYRISKLQIDYPLRLAKGAE